MKLVKKYRNYVHVYETDLDLEGLKETSSLVKDFVTNYVDKDYPGINTGPETTRYFNHYNLCLFVYPETQKLYDIINRVANEHIQDWSEPWYLQCWLNWYNEGEYVDWHEHSKTTPIGWHGFVCVDTHESKTSYRFPKREIHTGESFDVESKDGHLVIGASDGDQHRTYPWPYKDRPRITIAFDIVPRNVINPYDYAPNHWMPLIQLGGNNE